jgi:predicted acetyltransferase
MRIETKPAGEMSQFEKARTDCVVTSSLYAYHTGIQWAGPDWAVMVWEDEELVSNVHIIDRVIQVDACAVRVGGIGNISTKVEWRKRGYASAALKAATAFLADPLKVDFGLMTATEAVKPIYEKKGWKMVAASLQMDQPDGKTAFNYPVLVLPVMARDWPPGPIDLCGLPW